MLVIEWLEAVSVDIAIGKAQVKVFLPGTALPLQHFVRLWLLIWGKDEIKPEENPEDEEEDKRANRLSWKKGRKQLRLFNLAKQ